MIYSFLGVYYGIDLERLYSVLLTLAVLAQSVRSVGRATPGSITLP